MTDEEMAAEGGDRRETSPALLTLDGFVSVTVVSLDVESKLLLVFGDEAAWHAAETLGFLRMGCSAGFSF